MIAVKWPLFLKDDRGRVVVTGGEPKQGVRERGAKCGAGEGNATGAVVSPCNITGERSKQDGTKDSVGVGEEGFDHWFWIYVVIVLIPL